MVSVWAASCFEAAFGTKAEAVLQMPMIRANDALSFYFKVEDRLVHGLLFVGEHAPEHGAAAALQAFWRMRAIIPLMVSSATVLIEQTPRPIGLLMGSEGVWMARGQGAWLALADEGRHLQVKPWQRGQEFELEIGLWTPELKALVLVFPEKERQGFAARLQPVSSTAAEDASSTEASRGRRVGRTWAQAGLLWFGTAPCLDGRTPAFAASPPQSTSPQRAQARWAVVRLSLVDVQWRTSEEGRSRFCLGFVPCSSGTRAASSWLLQKSGDRIGLRRHD